MIDMDLATSIEEFLTLMVGFLLSDLKEIYRRRGFGNSSPEKIRP